MSLVPYWSGIQYSGYRRLGALALEYAAKYGVTAAYARMVLGKRKRLYPGMGGRFRKSRRKNTQARQAYRIAKRVVNAGKELKFHMKLANFDTPIPVPEGGTVLGTFENNVPQGGGSFQRVGKEIAMQWIEYRVVVNRDTASLSQALRMVVFNYKSPNGSSVFTADYFGSYQNGPPAANNNTLMPKNPLNWWQSKTLFDRTIQLDANSGRPSQLHFKFRIPLNGLVTKYATSDTAGTSIETNGLCLIFISDVPTNEPTVAWTSILAYKDR